MTAERKINLRALEPADIELLLVWENNREIWTLSNTLAPFSKHILEKYIESSHLDIYQTRQLRLMIDMEEAGLQPRTVGCIDLFDFEPFHLRAGVGILIAENSDRNRGIAFQALQELLKYAFTILQLHQLFCNIGSENKASLKLFEKAGFSIIGLKKEWNKTAGGFRDEYLLQKIHR
jgi:diamine N-acetyltransferase